MRKPIYYTRYEHGLSTEKFNFFQKTFISTASRPRNTMAPVYEGRLTQSSCTYTGDISPFRLSANYLTETLFSSLHHNPVRHEDLLVECRFQIRDFFSIYANTALLHIPARLGFRGYKSGLYQQRNNIDLIIRKIIGSQFGCRHIRSISLGKQCLRTLQRAIRLFFSMYQLRQLLCQHLFGSIQLAALPGLHLMDFL